VKKEMDEFILDEAKNLKNKSEEVGYMVNIPAIKTKNKSVYYVEDFENRIEILK
jgi:hypothetical protein